MRMVQYVIQVQQLGLRVGAQKNRLNAIEVILFEYLLCISGFRRKVLLLLLNTPESIRWSVYYYGDVQTDLKSCVAPLE